MVGWGTSGSIAKSLDRSLEPWTDGGYSRHGPPARTSGLIKSRPVRISRGVAPSSAIACERFGPVDPRNPFVRDAYGRTVLFAAAEQGRQDDVSRIIFSLAGTGFAPQRLALIVIEDNDGLTAADVAEQGGHRAIAELLRGEQARMELFE